MGTVRLRPNPEMQRRMQLQRCVCGDDAALCRITLDTSSVIKMDGFTATQSRNHGRVTAMFSAFVALANLRYINAINNNNNNTGLPSVGFRS